MKAITITIKLLEPMLCVGLEGDPNAGVSLKYIPGSVLRGAIIGKYGKILDAATVKERKLFFDGSVRYLNAYPLVKSKRSLPVPLSWHIEKDEEEIKGCEFYDFVRADKAQLKNPKGLSISFFAFENTSTIYKADIKTRLAVHTQRDAKKGRSTNENGAVFRYESIMKGTKFSGAIISEKDCLLDEILKLIPKGTEIFVGGSRTSGYGKAKIVDSKITEWIETASPKDLKINDIFTVTLLSHAIVRDDNGQFQTDITEAFEGFGKLDERKTYKKAEVIGGFNRKWGLPLPQATAIKAGSVFTFNAKKDIATNEFQSLIESGIGEKRLDGFGRIAINLSEKDDEFSFNDVTKQKDTVALSSSALGKKILERIVRQRMEEKLLETVPLHDETSKKVKEKISNSQISRLRLLLRAVLRDEKGVESIEQFFKELKKTARDQFSAVRVTYGENKGNLQQWITESLKKKNLFGSNIELTIGNDSGKAKANNKADELQVEYHLRLIDAVLAKAAKEKQ